MPNDLRQRAQKRLSNHHIPINNLSHDELKELVEELRIHEMELQIQQEELRELNAQLQAAHARYRRLFTFAPAGHLVMDDHQHILEANTTAAALLGESGQDLIGQRITGFIHPGSQERFYLFMRRLLKGEEPEAIECQLTNRDGVVMLVEGMVYQQDDAMLCLLALTDISEQKRAQAELAVANKVLREFVDNVSHELRTPLANFRLYLHLLLKNPEKQERYLDTLQRESARLEHLVEELLLLARLDHPDAALDRRVVDLAEHTRIVVTDRRPMIRQQVTMSGEAGAVRADATMIERVVGILLENAARYTPPAGHIAVAVYREEQGMSLHVRDDGPGIPPAERPHVFKRFYRGAAGQGQPGTGLGLAIAKQIVEAHDGRIALEPNSAGTHVTVWLPAGEDDE